MVLCWGAAAAAAAATATLLLLRVDGLTRAIQRGPRPVSARFLAKLFTAFGASIEVQARHIGMALEPWVRASRFKQQAPL